ncbi:MAG TPA: tetratricopeptide repeat protein [Pseudomonadota bacterium]|nr:tetratricopeptide repeat protein [Pseudomonadota bacterium]
MRKTTFAAAAAFALLSGPGLSGSLGDLRFDGFGPRSASAQEEDPEITNMAKQHYKLGQDAYAAGKYDVAIKELKKAYVLKRIPAILVNIAMTYRKTKDYDMAVYFYKKFLAEAPADDKGRPKIEAELAETEAERTAALTPAPLEPARPAVEMAKPEGSAPEAAKATPAPAAGKEGTPPAVAAGSKPASEPAKAVAAAKPAEATTEGAAQTAATPAPEAAAPVAAASADKPVTEWSHTPIDAVPPGQAVDVRVQMPVMKGVKVKVFYRKEGQAAFDTMELKRRGNEKLARLPPEITSGRNFQYYIEARDPAGTLVKSAGSEYNPNIVLIDSTARPQLVDAQGAADTSEEDEPARRVKSGPKRDIENEAVSFDIGGPNQSAMDRLRSSLRKQDKAKETKSYLSPMGWVGVGTAGLGLAGLATGSAFLGLAYQQAQIVSADSRCENSKMRCLFYGPNDDPTLNKAPKDSSSELESRGLFYDKLGIGLTVAGGVVLAAGGALLATDLIRKWQAERPKPVVPKTRKVKKVIEVEEPAVSMAPVVGPAFSGLVAAGRF